MWVHVESVHANEQTYRVELVQIVVSGGAGGVGGSRRGRGAAAGGWRGALEAAVGPATTAAARPRYVGETAAADARFDLDRPLLRRLFLLLDQPGNTTKQDTRR